MLKEYDYFDESSEIRQKRLEHKYGGTTPLQLDNTENSLQPPPRFSSFQEVKNQIIDFPSSPHFSSPLPSSSSSSSSSSSTSLSPDQIRTEISKFLNDPILIKVQNQYIRHVPHSLYKIPVSCGLCNGYKYLIVVVKDEIDGQARIGNKKKLSELNWVNLQTRFYHTVDPDTFLSDIKGMNGMFTGKLNYIFTVKERSTQKCVYSCPLVPLKLELIPSGKNPTAFEYGDNVYLSSAIESFYCSLTFV